MMKMKYKKIQLLLGGIALALVVMAGAYVVFGVRAFASHDVLVTIDPDKDYPVVNVIDGDTFEADIEGTTIKVRVLGIDTPETVDPRKPVQCYGKEASDEAKHLLTGKMVKLMANPDREKLDKYKRYLLYVYLNDGLFYNEFMVANGYAREYTFNNEAYQMQSRFRKAEADAKASGIGLWKACPQGK